MRKTVPAGVPLDPLERAAVSTAIQTEINRNDMLIERQADAMLQADRALLAGYVKRGEVLRAALRKVVA